MTSNEFVKLCRKCERMLRAAAPYKTGNLRYDAIKLEMLDANTCRLYVDENIAPYMEYTNEPWKPPRKNPNEGWFDRAAQQIAEYLARELKGELKKS